MPPINFTVACVVVLSMAAVMKSYAPLISSQIRVSKFVFYATRAATLGAAISVVRLGYWDITQYLSGDYWPILRDALGGQQFSTVFNAALLLVAKDLLMARVYLIPENERHHWRWWNVVGHPAHLCFLDWRINKVERREPGDG